MKLSVLLIAIIFIADKLIGVSSLQRSKKLPIIKVEQCLFSSNSENKRQGPCSTLHATPKQKTMYRRDPGLARAVEEARRLIANYCKKEFEFDHWDCSINVGNIHTLDSQSPEHACCTAITAATLVYAIARACAKGNMTSCSCGEDKDPAVTKRLLLLGLCNDNLKSGRRIARNFVHTRRLNHGQNQLFRHNFEVGIQIQKSLTNPTCRCHGMSGSCTQKICWQQSQTYEEILKEIKKRCFRAIIYNQDNTASHNSGKKLKLPPNSPLMYVDESPSFCSTVRGRKCRDANNCATLCCGHGYNVEIINVTKKCRCVFENFSLHCDTCVYKEEKYTCK